MVIFARRLLWASASLLVTSAGCSSKEAPTAATAATDGPDASGTATPDAASLSSRPVIPDQPAVCNGETCEVPASGDLFGLFSCCLEDGSCGVETPLAPGSCLPANQPGTADGACDDFVTDSRFLMPGCCGPNGCGGYHVFGSLGCIPNAELDRDPIACELDPDGPVCAFVTEVTCDGPEDCPSEQVCCGQSSALYGRMTRFGCFDSCVEQNGTWHEICHSDDDCTNSTHSCRTHTTLPGFLARCAPSGLRSPTGSTAPGEINCGDAPCRVAEKCCLQEPAAPHCVAADQPCPCVPPPIEPDGGLDAGGGSSRDAGSDRSARVSDAGPSDASQDAAPDR